MTIEDLRAEIATVVEEDIRPVLPRLGRYKITFIARLDGNPEADVVVTQDDRASLIELLNRRMDQ